MKLSQVWSTVAILAVVSGATSAHAEQTPAASKMWTFDTETAGAAPIGLAFAKTGEGRDGRWVVHPVTDAPSGSNVLAQMDTDDTDYRFPLAVAEAPQLQDVQLSVKCKPVSGKVDQACGLVFRYRDENNYYITRANALENNIRLYFVKDGARKQIGSFKTPVKANAWHDYRVEAKGRHISVFWDGKQVLSVDDDTFIGAGKIGLWTKADSVSYFDDLAVTPL